jgi:lipopolysaccharide exporter
LTLAVCACALVARAVAPMFSFRKFSTLARGNSLKAKAARGSVFLAGGSGAEYALRFLRQIILTKILAPEAFGAMAIVLAVNNIFEATTEVGIKQAVIQHPQGGEKKYLNGAWWFSFIRGVGLYVIAFLISPLVARFYQKPDLPDLTPLLQAAFVAVLFNGAMSTRAYAAQKTMNYWRWVALYHGGGILGVITAIALGLTMGGVWALVIGFIVEAAARFVLSFVFCPMLPRWDFDRAMLGDLFRYARGMLGLPILTVLYNQCDVFVVGRLMPREDLGLYSVVYGFAQMPNQLYGAILVPILMSAFASMQSDPQALVRNLLRSTKYVAMIALPAFAVLVSAAPQILSLVFGPAYADVSLAFSILCATVAVRVICRGMVTVFFATGRPHLTRQALFIRLVVMLALIFPLTHQYGLSGAATAGLISSIAGEAFNLYKLNQIIGLKVLSFASGLWQGAATSAAILAVWQFVAVLL